MQRQTLMRYFWIFPVILLVACSPGSVTSTTLTASPTGTMVPVTLTAIPSTTETPALTPTRTPRPTMTTPPFVVLDGLYVAYILKGNLFVEESGKQPMQLTNSGQDSSPQFSDDARLLIFYRGSNLYSINTDGSGEHELDIANQLAHLTGRKPDQSSGFSRVVFVPRTHQLLFQTSTNHDLLLLDLDSAKIRQFFPPGGQVTYFQVAPNGRRALVIAGKELDVISLDGLSRRRLIDFPPDGRVLRYSPELYWSADANTVTLVLTQNRLSDFSHVEPLIIRQYFLDGRRPVEINLDPPPVNVHSHAYAISPDGNWVAYSYCNDFTQDHTPQPDGAYLGNLRKGTAQHLGVDGCPDTYYWNADSQRFLIDAIDKTFLGNIQGQITLVGTGWGGGNWLDHNRYTDNMFMGELGKEGVVLVEKQIPGLLFPDSSNFTVVFVDPNKK